MRFWSGRPRWLWRIPLWALSASSCRVYVAAMPLSAVDDQPRDAERAVLYRVIDERLGAFLELCVALAAVLIRS